MKLLIIGDPHLRHTHLTQGVQLLTWIERQVEEIKPDLVVELGDAFDTHCVIRSEVLAIFDAHLRRVAIDMNVPYACVLGNHEFNRPNDSTYHALRVFKGRKNVEIFDEPRSYLGHTFVPYLPVAEDYPKTTDAIVFTHNTFVGADYGFKIADGGIPTDGLTADLTISGHIHKRGSLADGKVVYPGTPMAISAAEVDQAKGILLLDTDTYEQTFIESPFPIWRSSVHRVGVEDLKVNETDHWVVTLVGYRAEIKAFLESKSTADLRKHNSITFKTEFLDSLKDKSTSIKVTTSYDMVDQYVDRIYAGSQDRDVLKVEVKKILDEVSSHGNH